MDILTQTISLLFRHRQTEIGRFGQDIDHIQRKQLHALLSTARKTEWKPLDLVIMCFFSRFLYLTRSIYFTGLSDGVSVYVYGQYAHLSFRYFEPPRFIFSNLYDLL